MRIPVSFRSLPLKRSWTVLLLVLLGLPWATFGATLGVTSVTEADSQFWINKVRVRIRTTSGSLVSDTTGIGPRTTFSVTAGNVVEVTAPREVYRDINQQDITDSVQADPQLIQDEAEERFTAIGISVNNQLQTGDPTVYQFTMGADNVEIIVKWRHEFALVIAHDFTDTQSSLDPVAGGSPWAGPLTSEAAGNPTPEAKKHWIKSGETEIATIDGTQLDFTRPGLDVRYVPKGYRASGPPNGNPTTPLAEATFSWDPGQAPPPRQQVPQFNMSGPAKITFVWQIQFGVRVNVDDPARAALPKVFKTSGGGVDTEVGGGEGTFWFNPGTHVKVATPANESGATSLALSGWISGDGYYFSSSGDVDSSTGNLTQGGPTTRSNGSPVGVWKNQMPLSPAGAVVYRGLDIPQLGRAARVQWTYGIQRVTLGVKIGEYVFQNDPANAAIFTNQPSQIVKVGDSPAVGNDAMTIWDPVAHRLYPLVPGTFTATWKPYPDAKQSVEIRVTADYPNPAHYPHIANTPPVALDPDANDDFVFKELKYSENSAAVDSKRQFTASAAGKSVLLFAEIQRDGRGQPREFLRVRVVDTKLWNTTKPANAGSAIVGRKVTDAALDRANLGTGYVMFQQARFNPFIYDSTKLDGLAAKDVYDMTALRSGNRSKIVTHKDKLPGPIIPVNLHPGAGDTNRVVVIWYDDPTVNDELLWPYQAQIYQPVWPANAAEGLGRIVIASQYGSEGLDEAGANQVVVGDVTNVVTGADGQTVTNIVPAETTYNPSRLQQVQIYHQPDPTKAGYNPNEEHALMAPSLRFVTVSPRPSAVYALRDNDLNDFNHSNGTFTESGEGDGSTYTSHPFVLSQFFDTADNEFKMRVYRVFKSDTRYAFAFPDYSPTNSFGTNASTARELQNKPHVTMEAGEPVQLFYPLGVVIGAAPPSETFGINLKGQKTYWEDHKGSSWSVSGGEDAWFTVSAYYPLAPDFWWPSTKPGFIDAVSQTENRVRVPRVGDSVSFLPQSAAPLLALATNDLVTADVVSSNRPIPILYQSEWPKLAPVLKAGETLTFPGGEYRADHAFSQIVEDGELKTVETPGLPGVLAFACAEVVFDSLNSRGEAAKWRTNWTARVAQVLDKRSVPLTLGEFPADLAPATRRTRVKQGKYVFGELPASLQNRVRFDPLGGKLEISGLLNDKAIGDATLTASPPAVYVLEPNIITATESNALVALSPDNSRWRQAVKELVMLSRNPAGLSATQGRQTDTALTNFWRTYYQTVGTLPLNASVPPPIAIADAANGYLVGLEPEVRRDANDRVETIADPVFAGLRRVLSDPQVSAPVRAFGPGLAVLPNGDFLNPDAGLPEISWITVVENNDPSLAGSPITPHVIKVDRRERYRGAIKTSLSDNVFDENLGLRHQGDFGANADDLYFEWWYRPDDGSLNVPPPDLLQPGQPNPWKVFPDPTGQQGKGRFQITLKGNPNAPEALLADSWWFVRYRHAKDVTAGTDWNVEQKDKSPRVNFTWAGAGNSDPFNDFDADGLPDYRAQLAQGWIKRVLDAVNPYEARIRAFDGDNPATKSSMLSQFGARFEGPVALNPDKNVIENVGLIELYETILKRGRDLSIDLSQPVSTPAIANALELASTRISDFYTILGNEAYTDALDPTIGYGSALFNDLSGANPGYGNLAPAVFCFQNQMSSMIEEELGLLRGVDDYFARPVYNRLFWNFTKGEGEAAYANNYNVTDINLDGFIDEKDAMILFPQGHGDAWGHYLTALRNQYDLLRHENFNWVSRSEFYNLMDIVIKVDFLDERKFAQTAAAKAKAGAEIVNMTYRSKYVEDPKAQWQGYTDSNKDRGWGVQEWARRAGQGAYFDWVTANALLPAKHPNDTLEGIQKVDRAANSDIAVISANMNAVQATFDQANKGQNPLGLARDALVFDIDPTFLEVGSTAQIGTRAVQALLHFDQIYERALKMMEQAVAVWNNANATRNELRQVANSEAEFRNQVYQEDLSYKNQLIKIFGKPYEGTIGPGKLYPAGYDGPDLLTYMYVDVRQIDNSTVPGPTKSFATFDTNGTLVATDPQTDSTIDVYGAFQGSDGGKSITTIDNSTRLLFSPSFATDKDASPQTPALAQNGLYGVQYTDLSSPKVPLEKLTQRMPVTAAGYTFQAPRDWGKRLAVGELQTQINAMLQQEAQVASAIGAWDSLQGGIVRQIRLINARIQTSDDIRARNEAFIRSKEVIGNLIKAIEGVIDIIKTAKTTTVDVFGAIHSGIPRNLPTGGFAISPGDAVSAIVAGTDLSSATVKTTFNVSQSIAKAVKLAAEIGLDIAENEVNLANDSDERALSKKEWLVELENLVGDEPIRRIEIFKEIEALRGMSDQFRAMVDEGSRLVDERAAYNKRVAAQTQRSRYQDMTFRVSLNHALQTYRSAFDLASKYAYLAARAYDYETNFDPSDPGSPNPIFTDIMRARSLGLFDGEPRLGKGGLAEALAKMKLNYEVLKGQLGVNNPQIEIGKISLRTEHFRILPKPAGTDEVSVSYLTNTTANTTTVTTVTTVDGQPVLQPDGFPSAGQDENEVWRQTLRNARVDDLWMVPEYRYFCRPFAAEADGNGQHVAEPGIVIRFASQIHAGKNFFGQPLSGGDHAYDPSHFATKIQSVGAWFSDYLSGDVLNDLPATPRLYLIPAGDDIMSVPTSANPDIVRIWKVVDQSIPAPFPATTASLDKASYIPVLDSLSGRFGEPRKYSAFRAYHDGTSVVDMDELVGDTRLVGRSIWNTRWVLIIPGRMLNADPNVGLDRFIQQVSDIKLVFRTYGISGG